MPLINTVPPRIATMRQMAQNQPDHQVAYFTFETGAIHGPYAFANHEHAEEQLVQEIVAAYQAYAASQHGATHGHRVGHVFVYTVLSPCGEAGHMCGALLRGLLQHIPVNHHHFLGYTLIYSGIPGHQNAQGQALIQARSQAEIQLLIQSPWRVCTVP